MFQFVGLDPLDQITRPFRLFFRLHCICVCVYNLVMEINDYLTKHDFSIRHFAGRCDIPQPTMSRYANKRMRVGRADYALRIVDASNGEITLKDLSYAPIHKRIRKRKARKKS